ncbi:YrhK family protein [Streptomyces sp. CS159]|uniref:YrhK family protein n=1 Tax=Streptomyces sp. CS159 TaxID=1982762 RepID=UPI00211B697B|nr:YrhK family protein [Streptomyces sp. CS159]
MLTRLERYLLQDFPFLHLVIGGFDNTAFLVGSVFFLFPSLERIALWLFVIGSLGMLVGTIAVRHLCGSSADHGSKPPLRTGSRCLAACCQYRAQLLCREVDAACEDGGGI